MTDQELKKLVADLVRTQAATEKQIAENDKRLTAQIAKSQADIAKAQADIAKAQTNIAAVNKQLSKQLGELGNKFGSFTEGMAWPSMQKLLLDKFQMDTVAPRFIKRLNGRTMELDVLAYSNGEINAAYIVEVKSHLRAEGVRQMQRTMQEFTEFFPEHRGKRVYGISAAVDAPESVKQQALKAGLYLARIHDGNFKLDVPAGFRAKDFGRANGVAA